MRLSSTQIKMYTECPKKYKLWYKQNLRPTFGKGALFFGLATDRALNHLLQTRNLQEALAVFEKEVQVQEINKKIVSWPKAINVVYAETDFDYELLSPEDIQMYKDLKAEFNLDPTDTIKNDVKYIREQKAKIGYKALEEVEKRLYNLANWLTLRAKGRIMIRSYNEEVMPTIKNVLAVQKKGILPNSAGDEIVLYLDLVVEFHDGTIYLMDNKTSARDYDPESAMRSQQLIIYNHSEKEQFKLNGVGFYVLSKQIRKNKVKICSKCNYDGSGGTAHTCDNEVDGFDKKGKPKRVRCNADWNITINPKAKIECIKNLIPEAAEDLVMETCDSALEGIKKEAFGPNLNACGSANSDWRCPFYNKCWKGTDDDLEIVDSVPKS